MLDSVTDGIEFREARSVAPFVEAGHAIGAFISVWRGPANHGPRIAACAPAFPFPVLVPVASGEFSCRSTGALRRPSHTTGGIGVGRSPAHSLSLSTIHHRLTPVQGIGHHD
ncbi:hypothetical protein [Sphaerisporangium sp. TRM90804]|uniref:hypothetical protein n=1 Tax=Sphaerisporangium sp. TRM90804 TaxID=3031113 RepID=UPI0024478B01|nr:hypothetical protein [Sphaerisporangium sp. TRM90804]MDH2426534.1 hypothetical protein [Sphaerisporangium sp. TRM90804]